MTTAHDLCTFDEVAGLIPLKEKTLLKLCDRGQVGGLKYVRFSPKGRPYWNRQSLLNFVADKLASIAPDSPPAARPRRRRREKGASPNKVAGFIESSVWRSKLYDDTPYGPTFDVPWTRSEKPLGRKLSLVVCRLIGAALAELNPAWHVEVDDQNHPAMVRFSRPGGHARIVPIDWNGRLVRIGGVNGVEASTRSKRCGAVVVRALAEAAGVFFEGNQ